MWEEDARAYVGPGRKRTERQRNAVHTRQAPIHPLEVPAGWQGMALREADRAFNRLNELFGEVFARPWDRRETMTGIMHGPFHVRVLIVDGHVRLDVKGVTSSIEGIALSTDVYEVVGAAALAWARALRVQGQAWDPIEPPGAASAPARRSGWSPWG